MQQTPLKMFTATIHLRLSMQKNYWVFLQRRNLVYPDSF